MNLKLITHRWPQKLIALVLALLMWYFVTTDEANIIISQRTMLLPVSVEGLGDHQVTSGIPELVEVTVVGPSQRIDALRTESIEVVLDLRNVTSDFERRLQVIPPQGIDVTRTNPAEVIGQVETRIEASIPVQVAYFGKDSADMLIEAQADPEDVIVTGRSQQVEQVFAAIAPVEATSGEHSVRLYPADERGQPVSDVQLSPREVVVQVSEAPVYHTRDVPIELQLPELEPFVIEDPRLTRETLRLSGPRSQLDALEAVPGRVEFATSMLREGDYNLLVRPELPEEVHALETARVELRLTRPDNGAQAD